MTIGTRSIALPQSLRSVKVYGVRIAAGTRQIAASFDIGWRVVGVTRPRYTGWADGGHTATFKVARSGTYTLEVWRLYYGPWSEPTVSVSVW